MGNSAAPHLANIFLCNFEEKLLNRCPSTYKPLVYRRFLKDAFVVFNSEDCANSFFAYINNFHNNINFTIKKELDKCLPFLDMNVTRHINGSFLTSVYRKPTHTGLTTSFF